MTLDFAPVVAYDAIFDSAVITQVMSSSVAPNIRKAIGRYSGGVDPQAVYVLNAEPKVMLSTSDIAGALAAAALMTGTRYFATSVVVPYQKRAEGGTFDGVSQHMEFTATQGLLYVKQITANQDDEGGAKADLEFAATWDGSTLPLTPSTGNTLAAAAFTGMFDLGPVELNSGAALEGLTGFTINTGLTIRLKRYGGSTYPQRCYLIQRDPTIEFTFEDFDAIPANLFASLTSAVAYLRKRADGSSHVADATATHTKFTLTGGLTQLDNAGAQGLEDGQVKIMLTGKSLAVNTASAIT